MKNILFIVILFTTFILVSCNNRYNSKIFIENGWILDSSTIKTPLGIGMSHKPLMLIADKEGKFNKSFNDFNYVRNFKIIKDTVLLDCWDMIGNKESWKLKPYKIELINDTNMVLESYNIAEKGMKHYFTKVTDVKNNKINNTQTDLYKYLADKTFYPIEVQINGEIVDRLPDDAMPEKKYKFLIKDNKLSFFIFGENNNIKISNNRIYVFNKELTKLISSCKIIIDERPEVTLIELELYDSNAQKVKYVLQEIDEGILI